MGIADPYPNSTAVIPKNYFCHFVVDLSGDPAKVDVTWYNEQHQDMDEFIEIVVNRTQRGRDKQDYFSD